jgi:hypothetical protein
MMDGDAAYNDWVDCEARLARVREWMTFLLARVGNRGFCSGRHCRAPVIWVEYTNGKRSPFEATGEPHWANCPDRDAFKRGKPQAQPAAREPGEGE